MIKYVVNMGQYQYPILLKKSIIYNIIRYVKNGSRKEVRARVTTLIEVNYLKYLINILYSNVELASVFPVLGGAHIGPDVLCRILQNQFEMLLINGCRCFLNVRYENSAYGVDGYYYLKCSSSFFKACKNVSNEFDLSFFS